MNIYEWIQQGSVSEEIAEKRGLKELVRCKDCKNNLVGRCDNLDIWVESDLDWFCADGERKDNSGEKQQSKTGKENV